MPCVFHNQNSPYWIAKFRSDDGRMTCRSTKVEKKPTLRTRALAVAMEWEAAARKARAGELTRAAVLATLSDMLERTTGETISNVTVRGFFDEWEAKKSAPGKSKSTADRYSPIMKGFLAHVGPRRAAASIRGITTSDIEEFQAAELAAGKSNVTANFAVKVLRAVFSDAHRLGHLPNNPAKAAKMLDDDSEEREPLSDEEIRMVLAVADDQWRGMVLIALHCGLRLTDAAGLTWANVDLVARTLHYQAKKTSGRAKRGAKTTTVALHPEVCEHLETLPSTDKPDAPLFPSLHGRASGSAGGLSDEFSRLLAKAGVKVALGKEREGKGRRWRSKGFHSLRHSMISRMANASVPADVRKQIAGHGSDEAHRKYTHLKLDTQRRAVEGMAWVLSKPKEAKA